MSQVSIIDIEGNNPQIPTQFNADSGFAIPLGNVLEILGTGGITTSGSGNTITIDGSGASTPITLTGDTGGALSPTADNFNILGGYLAAGSTPVQVNGAVSTLTVNVQTSQAIAASNATNIGLAAFDSSSFAVDANGFVTLANAGPFVESVSGTADRITSTGGQNPVIDIAATYVGQTSITTLGTVTTGTWQGTIVDEVYGGTGQSTYATGDTLYASAANTLSKLTAGSDGQVLTLASGIPSWAPPTTGTVTSVTGTADRITSTGGATPQIDIAATYVGQTSITTLGTVTTGTWNGDEITVPYGGTGQNSLLDHGILVGSGVGPVTSLPVASNGQIPIGSTGSDPIIANISEGEAIDIANGAGSITISCETATSSNLGVATFDENDFLVTAGDVSIAQRVRLTPGMTENLEVFYSSPTLTIRGANGSDLSATNPGYVVIRGSSGSLILHKLTSNFTFQDANGAGNVNGNEFGVLTDAIGTNTVPFFIYFGHDNSNQNPVAFLSRFPNLTTQGPTTSIGTPSSAIADSSGDMWCFSNITTSSYDNNPIACVGSIRMFRTSSFSWKVTPLSNDDGIGRFQTDLSFVWLPVFRGSGTAGSFTYSSRAGIYKFKRSGMCNYAFQATTSGSSGSPSGLMVLRAPFTNGMVQESYGPFWCPSTTSVPSGSSQVTMEFGTGNDFIYFRSVVFNTSESYCSVDASAGYRGSIEFAPDAIKS